MSKDYREKPILALSLPLAGLIIITSCVGLFTPDFYTKESLNWQAQSAGQDIIDLFLIIPCLVISSVFAYRNSRIAVMLWSGIIFYLIYTFVIYCFNVHFNGMFILYCMILGLSFYSFLYFLFAHILEPFVFTHKKIVIKIIAIYLMLIAILFYMLWLSEIFPALMNHTTPQSLIETGLFTNPVRVLDLSVCLPAFFITAILLLRKKSLGILLTPAILVFCILMNITIGILIIIMKMKGLEADYAITIIMGLLALISIALLIWFLNSVKINNAKAF